ncbi:MAG TPA: ATP-binding cassette domain-containing protein, partial [Nitrososphaerales archaeon]|nr:ATP-binding cassette domain-containing protein [Nitrososphaerales archaeon]
METQEDLDLRTGRDGMTEPASLGGVEPKFEIKELKAGFRSTLVLKGIDIRIPPNKVTAVMGPSGCGKTTFVRCLNRLHELTPGATIEGEALLDGEDIYGKDVDPVAVRRRIGMV